MSAHANQEWLDRSNAETLYHLERQGRTGPGLVPFLGAGISTPFGFKNWRNLLLHAAPPSLAPGVEQQLDNNDYEGAAETLLRELGADGFQNLVAASAGDSNLDAFDFREGTVSLLPLLASGPVITTNFDRVLERVFESNGTPFESVISGPRPDLIVDALHGNRRVLVKLHGDWQDRVGRTFAKSDYDENYGEEQRKKKRELLTATEQLLFSSRSLLFIGASLGPDRTVTLLQEVHKQYAGIRHFAVMMAPTANAAFDKLEKHLRSCGVLPLWYHAETSKDHGREVQKLVAKIIERISVQTIEEPLAEQPLPATIVPAAPKKSKRVQELNAHFDRVVRLIGDGRITFFLGSAIHAPTKLMANEFYEELSRVFECEALSAERFAVAQYIADRHGRQELYSEIRKLFARATLVPRETHELFAAWGQFKTDTGESVPYPTVITTNYDDVLERRLEAAGLPFHVLSYQAAEPHQGLFYHQCDRKGLRIIERPRNIRDFSDAFVLVKLNGGLPQGRIPESYVTARLDYWDLAARIPDVLPEAIQQTLLANPLLFLGHGLRAPDVEALVRFAHRDRPGPRSWAVVLGKPEIEYWRQCGVEILDHRVDTYVNELHDRLSVDGPNTAAAASSSDGRRPKAKSNKGSSQRSKKRKVRGV